MAYRAKLLADQKSESKKATECLDLKFTSTPITKTINYTRKIRIYPTELQKEVFKTCLECSNYYYNKTIDYLQTIEESIIKSLKKEFLEVETYVSFNQAKYIIEKAKKIPKFRTVRDKLFKEKIKSKSFKKWLEKTPKHTRAEAIHDAVIAFEVNIKGYMRKLHNSRITAEKKKTTPREVTKFALKKRTEHIVFHVEKNQINLKQKILMSRRTKKDKFDLQNKEYNKIKNQVPGDSKIIFTKSKQWYLCLSLKRSTTNYIKHYDNVALDPGVRTFQTFYSPNGVIGKLGEEVNKKLFNLGKRIDKLTSDAAEYKEFHTRANNKVAYRIRKRINILWSKIKNITDDLHHKTANYLTKRFKTIIIPNSNISSMITGNQLSKETKRSLLSLSHFKFRAYLKRLGTCRNNQIIEVSEAFTSKTCGSCGKLNDSLGGNKVFKCGACSYELDRDIHGARNIMVRTLKYSGLMQSLET